MVDLRRAQQAATALDCRCHAVLGEQVTVPVGPRPGVGQDCDVGEALVPALHAVDPLVDPADHGELGRRACCDLVFVFGIVGRPGGWVVPPLAHLSEELDGGTVLVGVALGVPAERLERDLGPRVDRRPAASGGQERREHPVDALDKGPAAAAVDGERDYGRALGIGQPGFEDVGLGASEAVDGLLHVADPQTTGPGRLHEPVDELGLNAVGVLALVDEHVLERHPLGDGLGRAVVAEDAKGLPLNVGIPPSVLAAQALPEPFAPVRRQPKRPRCHVGPSPDRVAGLGPRYRRFADRAQALEEWADVRLGPRQQLVLADAALDPVVGAKSCDGGDESPPVPDRPGPAVPQIGRRDQGLGDEHSPGVVGPADLGGLCLGVIEQPSPLGQIERPQPGLQRIRRRRRQRPPELLNRLCRLRRLASVPSLHGLDEVLAQRRWADCVQEHAQVGIIVFKSVEERVRDVGGDGALDRWRLDDPQAFGRAPLVLLDDA